jgi:hypothetical protein
MLRSERSYESFSALVSTTLVSDRPMGQPPCDGKGGPVHSEVIRFIFAYIDRSYLDFDITGNVDVLWCSDEDIYRIKPGPCCQTLRSGSFWMGDGRLPRSIELNRKLENRPSRYCCPHQTVCATPTPAAWTSIVKTVSGVPAKFSLHLPLQHLRFHFASPADQNTGENITAPNSGGKRKSSSAKKTVSKKPGNLHAFQQCQLQRLRPLYTMLALRRPLKTTHHSPVHSCIMRCSA